jgi:hypothetical protein
MLFNDALSADYIASNKIIYVDFKRKRSEEVVAYPTAHIWNPTVRLNSCCPGRYPKGVALLLIVSIGRGQQAAGSSDLSLVCFETQRDQLSKWGLIEWLVGNLTTVYQLQWSSVEN